MQAVIEAEAAGFDDVWMAEHHFMSYGTCPSAITFAANALGRTTRISVGTAVSVLSTVHPVQLAEQARLLDQLSGGRLLLGVGRGGPWIDLEVFGTGVERYRSGFPEALDQLLAGIRGGRAAGVSLVPGPRAGVPVFVASTSDATVRLAAQRALPMLLGMHVGDDVKRALVDRYAAESLAAGHDPASVGHVSTVVAHVADSRRDAVREVREAMPAWLAAGFADHMPLPGFPKPSRDPVAYTELLCDLHPVGSVADCTQRLRTSVERTGIRHVIMMVEGTGDRDRTMRTIARLGSEVLPVLRAVSSRAAPGSG